MKNLSKQKGFTLIEIIISLAIFTIVAVVAVGALLKITDANRKAIALKTTINNMSFALESMSRELRVGSDYTKVDLNNGGWELRFKSSKKGANCMLEYGYAYTNTNGKGTISKAQQNTCGEGLIYKPLIADDIFITSSNLVVSSDSTRQPRVLMTFAGYSGLKAKDRSDFAIQTSVSQRIK